MSSIETQPKGFAQYLNSEGMSFGLDIRLLHFIGNQTEKGKNCRTLLEDNQLKQAGLGAMHLLRIRRAWRRYQAGCTHLGNKLTGFVNEIERAARRWANRVATSEDQIQSLERAFSSTAIATLNRGRIRIHLKRPEEAKRDQLAFLAEHTEGCKEIPPHRWFAAARGVSDDLLWMEVLCPEGEAEGYLGEMVKPDLVEDLKRSVTKPVLDRIAKRSERQAIATAADSLYALVRKAPINDPVAGLATDGKQLFVKVLGGSHDREQIRFSVRDLKGLQGWLKRREITYAAVVRMGWTDSISPILQALVHASVIAEPVREAGLMKQAKQTAGSIKFAAAIVAARRFRDPLEGYAGIEPDQLGLGEYLDRVDPTMLKEALRDARDTATWERAHGKTATPVARGVSVNNMIKDIDDLRPGMELTGTVSNITHFGAFIELGFPVQGLVHLSELADRFVEHPSEVVQAGDRVRVRVIDVDQPRKRISLSMRIQRQTKPKSSMDKRSKAVEALDRLFGK